MTPGLATALPVPLTNPFRVGEWIADPRANTISRDGESLSVEPKVMDALTIMAAAPGRTFLRDEITDALWPDVVVGEDSLARLISKLRRALGDTTDAPVYIETIPKRGYRLIADTGTVAPSGDNRKRRSGILVSALVGMGVLVAMIVTGLRLVGQDDKSPAIELTERAHDLYMQFSRADNEAAITLYERALEADPDYAEALSGLANALVQRVIRWQGMPGGGIEATSLTEALSAGVTGTRNATALLDRAVDLGERAVRLSPEDPDALKALGLAHSARGELDRARELYMRAVSEDENAWEVMANLGELASLTGQPAAALEWYTQAYEAMDRMYSEEPQRVGALRASMGILIGDIYSQQGELEQAEGWYRRTLDQTPYEPEATTRLAQLLRSRGEEAGAILLCEELSHRVGAMPECEFLPDRD